MSLIRIITQTGPGGVITTILTYGTASYWLPDLARSELVFSAAVTGFLFMLILELLSKPAISFLSFPIILQVKRDMEKKTVKRILLINIKETEKILTSLMVKYFDILVYSILDCLLP